MQIRSTLKNIRNIIYWELQRYKLYYKFLNRSKARELELHLQKYEQMMHDCLGARAIPQYQVLKGYCDALHDVIENRIGQEYTGYRI